MEISAQTARRYVLGRQGLWPGRRWQGKTGTEAAIRAIEAVQVDTISVVARNHDLVLWSRVAGYQPKWLSHLLYKERQFFEFGDILFVYPLEEWPHWRAIMSRTTRWQARILAEMPEVIEYVRQQVRAQGPVASRDFKGRSFVPGGFRVVKDVNHGLQYLWSKGELLVHSRRGFDKVFELTENLLPAVHPAVTLAEAELFFVLKALRDLGLATPAEAARRVSNMLLKRTAPAQVKEWLQRLCDEGQVNTLTVEGRKETLFFPSADTEWLKQLERGETPAHWVPLATTTLQEVNFLAPLDNVIWDRARLKSLFDFDYVWEVYKPAELRRWGYYTLPVLYGDRLVARLDPKLSRKTKSLSILNFWLDDEKLADDPAFGKALVAGLQSFASFHQATSLDLKGLLNAPLSPEIKNRLQVVFNPEPVQ